MTKTKVAVLGGGLGSIAAAFELTSNEALRDRYEVTLYQQGWRLGGKGASGRNAAMSERIEEHGLHAFLGFYENAFQLMRDLYAEWGQLRPDARWKSWRDAFTPQRQVSITEELDGGWAIWNLPLPKLPGEPGDGQTVAFFERLVSAAVQLWLSWLSDLAKKEPLPFAELLASAAAELIDVRALLRGDFAPMLDDVGAALARWQDDSRLDDDVRRLVYGASLGAAILRGLIVDVIPRGERKGLAFIDQWDFAQWLERHGCPKNVSFWGPVRALYDLGFAYENGGRGRAHARAAAGVALRILLLLAFGYKDAPLWKMNAGMGDTIFGPAYEVLRARGVQFRFFHRVEDLELSATKSMVERVHLMRQVDLDVPEYDPLVWVKDLPCWPSEPGWGQIQDGIAVRDTLAQKELTLESAWCHQQTGTLTLQRGVDYDLLVCGISVSALPDIAPQLIEASDDWRRMLASTKTVQTQALQLWFDRDTEALGWTGGRTILTGYVEPFDTWGDLSHLLSEEQWPEPGGPKSLGYFCNAFPDATPIPPKSDEDFPRRERERVFDDARRYVEEHAGRLWPLATPPGQPGALDYDRLFDPDGGTGVDRLRAQYWRANIDPTERYVLSAPGSLQYRLWAGRSGFLNLYLAGDWVTTSLNAGCAEAAVEGGLRAAHAIVGYSPRPFVHRHVQDDLTLAKDD